MKFLKFIPLYLIALVHCTDLLANEILWGNESSSRTGKSRPQNAPSYIPNQYFQNENLQVKGRVVRDRYTNEFIAPVGYGIGRPPSKSAHKQFDPQKIRRRSGFGLGRASFGGGS